MTTTTAAAIQIFDEFSVEDATHLTFGQEPTSANAYVNHIGGIEGHHPWTWACGADLAQWGAFRDRDWWNLSRDIVWTLRLSEQSTGYGPGSDPVLAQRFDY